MHPGTLPKYAGLYVAMQAMMQGENHCKMTLHKVDTGIDTGAVIDTTKVPFDGQSHLTDSPYSGCASTSAWRVSG